MRRLLYTTVQRLARPLTLAVTMSALALPVFAGDHWLSRVRTFDVQGQESVSAAGGMLRAAATSANAVFDIVISLENNPQGDDDASVDGPNDTPQNEYEERIKEFANAVFQATNGAHKIGRVSIYRQYKQRTLADVQWEFDCTSAKSGGPWASPAGFQKPGKFIHFCTKWDEGSSSMGTPKGSGYTLAHEWGHYAYGIYDEYQADQCKINLGTLFGLTCPAWQPRATDTVSDTIMHDQWNAASGTVGPGYGGSSADYLEFSTPNHEPFKSTSTGTNGQKRFYNESGWTTLTRSPATDPRWRANGRTQYTTLTAPTAPNWIVTGGIAAAQSELDIRWIDDQVVELVIDRSGSMGGTPIANAKTGAGLLIAQLPEGDSAVGVASFNNATGQDFAIADIPDPDTGVKSDATAAVNALSAGGLTALYDGLILGLNQVNAFQTSTGTSREGVVYVLSDGADNSSSATEASVIAAYQAAGVPIVAFAYGGGAPSGTLGRMATATGGLFLSSPTTVSAIQAALLSANASFSDNVLLGSVSATATASSTLSEVVPIDSTMATAVINVNYTGAEADTTLSILDPSGADTGVAFDCTGSVSCTATLDSTLLAARGPGDYTVRVVNNTATDIDLTRITSGTPGVGGGYDISVGITGGSTVTYPAAMTITADVGGAQPLTGLSVEAQVTPPFGAAETLTLVDDGTGADIIAEDGSYTASYHYTANGNYSVVVTASNEAGNAQTSTEGFSIAIAENGSSAAPIPSSVTENFVRSAAVTATATGFAADDHADDPAVPAACTVIADDNIDTEGRIDSAADVDCFFFTPSSTTSDLVARVTGLSDGMSPVVTVFDAAGTNQLLQVDLAASENDVVGTVATVPASALNAAGHVVTVAHTDATATTGGYGFSLGEALVSDVPVVGRAPIPPVPPAAGGGGGIGPWSLLVLGLLALIGLRRRRHML